LRYLKTNTEAEGIQKQESQELKVSRSWRIPEVRGPEAGEFYRS
jgi:hypothetical protein